MELKDIYREFQACYTIPEKIVFLEELSRLNLPYYINYEGLIKAWTLEAGGH